MVMTNQHTGPTRIRSNLAFQAYISQIMEQLTDFKMTRVEY